MTERLKIELDTLPVSTISGALNEALEENAAVIVSAAPGAGKSTLLPLTILEALPREAGKIVMLEPRRVAARQIASRMAFLLGEKVGESVGYRIRFESRVSGKTRLEVVTEGVLTRMLLEDPALEGVAVVIFDEFHERSLNTDEAFALTRHCQQLLREDLRLVIMSATIDTSSLREALRAPVLESSGKMFPVELIHTKEESDPFNVTDLVGRTILQAHRLHEGDILAFLPGEAEIRRCAAKLEGHLGSTRIYLLYGLLSPEEQARAIAPGLPGERKVVLSTPIAETSLTIEGVRIVVDSGLCRKMIHDPRSGMSHLETVRISIDMAAQRTGRAGRLAPGVCYRLWSMGTESRMAPVRPPEILEADLTSLVLDTAIWGEKDIMRLPWLTPPPNTSVLHARSLLSSLGAIDAEGRVTDRGKALAKLPCHPRIAQMMLSADSPQLKALAADIAAILEEKDPLAGEADVSIERRLEELRRTRSSGCCGKWSRIARIAREYADMVRVGNDNSFVNPYSAGMLLASAYPERIGKAWKEGAGLYQLTDGKIAGVDAADPLTAYEWIVAASMHHKPGAAGKVFLAAAVSPSDLQKYVRSRDNISWDGKAGAVIARRETRIGAILLASAPLAGDVREKICEVICQAIVKDGASMLSFTPEVSNLQRRIAFLAARHPELELPDVSKEAICASAPEWGPLFIGKAASASELKKTDLCEVILSRLDYTQQQVLDRLAPAQLTVPTGSRIRLEYRQGTEAPVLRVRLQECFGLLDTPCVDGGRVPVLMELLSPGFKAVQLTSDLRSFWSGAYFEVRSVLRRRYPRHSWPDNPTETAPVRGVRKQ